ncbi:MAG: hypothetical protein U9N04_03140 [Patescibacteria group bacterium]|nr:hypothetical protein [Patescibacteria group bacterium]
MQENNNSSRRNYQEYWNTVEDSLNEGTFSGYKIAVVETEKILQMALDDKKFPGKDIDEQIKNAEIIIKNLEKLNYSRAMYDKIINEPDFDISAEDIKEIEMGYYRAVSDITKMRSKDIDFKERINLLLQKYFYGFPHKIKKVLILIVLFFLAIFLSTETATGRLVFEMLSDFSKFIFYKAVPGILVIAVVGIITVGGLYYWKSRRK